MNRFFGIDLRGLSVMRLLLGVTLLYDLAIRATCLEVFHTDQGVVPVAQAIANTPLTWIPSLHLLSGDWRFQAGLLIFHALAATALLVGWHTRIATVLCWFFTLSLHFRNELILNGGDYLLRAVLFWCLFLPLGARFSLDSRRVEKTEADKPQGVIADTATAGLLFQMCLLYWGSAMNKEPRIWLFDPQAIYYTLHLDPFTSPIGARLSDFTGILSLVTVAVYILEWTAPLLLLFGIPKLRCLGVGLLVSFHLSIAVFMQVGHFWLIPICALLAFLPKQLWDRILSKENDSAQSNLASALQLFLILIMLFYPVLNLSLVRPQWIKIPKPLFTVYRTLGLHYGWNMFAQVDKNVDGWYIIEAQTEDGGAFDLLTGQAMSLEKPRHGNFYPHQRWRRFMADLYRPGGEPYLRATAEYLAKQWKGSPIESIRVHYIVEPTPEKPGQVELEDRMLLEIPVEPTDSKSPHSD